MMIQKGDGTRKSKQRQKEELDAALEEKLFNGAHCGVEALVEIQFFYFLILFFCIFI
jgi:hypothetical protein